MTLNEIMAKWNFDPVDHKFIFQKMEEIPIWNNVGILQGIGRELDIDYLFNHSGEKTVTPVVEFLFKKYGGYLEQTTFVNKIIEMLQAKFYNNWLKTYQALMSQYNPIHNYNMSEREDVASKVTTSSAASTYGFDNQNSVPTDENRVTTQGDADENVRNLVRSGNIGVTTNQAMIEAELELRKKNYYEMIYRDIDSLLVLRIYD